MLTTVLAKPPRKLWTPKRLPGLHTWFKSDAGLYQDAARTTPTVADGDPVGGWADQSGNGRHASQSTSSKRPTLKLNIQNGRSVVRGDGTDDGLQTAAFGATLSQPYTLFLVHKFNVLANNQNVLDGLTDPNRFYLARPANNAYDLYFGTGTPQFGTTTTNWRLLRVVAQGASTKYQFEGGAEATIASNPGTSPLDGLTLFMNRNGTIQFFNGDIAELILCSGDLSAADDARATAYLNQRWAVY